MKIVALVLLLAFFVASGSTHTPDNGMPSPAAPHNKELAGKLVITGFWARKALQKGGVSAAYLVIANSGDADRLLKADTRVAKKTQLHMTRFEGDVMEMVPQDSIPLPKGGKVELKPSGLHIMLIDLNQVLKAGDSFELSLYFEKAGKVVLKVPVQ